LKRTPADICVLSVHDLFLAMHKLNMWAYNLNLNGLRATGPWAHVHTIVNEGAMDFFSPAITALACMHCIHSYDWRRHLHYQAGKKHKSFRLWIGKTLCV
jgi:hypothetical protein